MVAEPVKPVGAKQWLVAASAPPPRMMMFNSQPLLIQQVAQKSPSATAAIAAGPKPAPSKKDGAPDATSVFRTGDPFMDPWKLAGAEKPLPGQPPLVAARVLEGPVADKFQQQDVRLQAMESAMHQLQTAHQQLATNTETQMATFGQTLTQHVTQATQHFENIYGEQKSMTQSIATALQRQDDRLATSIDELKQLFLQSRGVKRTNQPAEDSMEKHE